MLKDGLVLIWELDMNLVPTLILIHTLVTEINVPRTFISFWNFFRPYGPYFGPYVY